MKKLILFLLLMVPFLISAQWLPVTSGTTNDLEDVHFPTDSIGYIVGEYGTILKSTDEGSSWQTIHLDSSKNYYSVFFTNNVTGYIAAGSLLKTTDGGLNWIEILTDTFNSIVEIYFVNDFLGFAGAENKVYKTTDGGNTWTAAIVSGTGAYRSIFFPSPLVGYFIGGSDFSGELFKTIDGGQTFIPITNGFQSIKEATYFINDTIGYMCGWYGGIIVKTVNGGTTWQQLDTTFSAQCWDVYFKNENIGYYIDNSGGYSMIKNSVNGGVTWNAQASLIGSGFNKFHFINDSTAVATGYNGTIYKTQNGGGLTGLTEESDYNGISVFPNIIIDKISVTSERSIIKEVSVYGLAGNLKSRIYSGFDNIDLSYLEKGIYFVMVITPSFKYTQKIIKIN